MLLSPQAERNWESLCSVLEDVLEDQSHRQLFALELGSGTGQHVIRFAQKMPFVTWQPSDIEEASRERNPEWGLPDIDVLRQHAYGNGLRLERMVEMEDYYKCLIFRKL
uniref:Zgc:103625 n=1 Tax=Oryzias sinensis TaxID=183150 RepID=A0A8C7XF75_9TELE